MKSWLARIGLALCLIFIAFPTVRAFYFDAGMRWQFILLFSFLTAYLLSPLCAVLGRRLGVLDHPSGRKIHTNATPLLGGLAIYCATIIPLLLNAVMLPDMEALLLSGTFIFLVGLLDDVRPLPPIWRFLAQILASAFLIFAGNISLKLFAGTPVPALDIPLTMLWLVGLTNAMNFFDGMDGLAAGLSIISALFLGSIAFLTNQPVLGWISVSIAGACLGFMPHNFIFGKSAVLFLGDSGSTFLGFMLASVAVFGEWSTSSHLVSLTAPVLIFGVLIFDMVYIILSRLKNRTAKQFLKPLATPGRDHLHHRLLFMGFARKEAAFTIFTISGILGVSALIIMDGDLVDALLGICQALLMFGVIVMLMWKGRNVRNPPPSTNLPDDKPTVVISIDHEAGDDSGIKQ